MIVMNSLRLLIILATIFLCSSLSVAGNPVPKTTFPDLLADEFLDDDEFDEFDSQTEFIIRDPLEPVNRFFFQFNDKLYEWVLKPVTNGYILLVPRELRVDFGNFYFNLSMPIRLLNSLLQGNFHNAGRVLSRFAINSTAGVWGLVDVAALEFDLRPVRADFGQTLGKWGVGEGIYFCWPVFGPSNIRATAGLVVDSYTHPVPYFHDSRALDLAYYTSNKLTTLSLNPNLYEDMKRFALDPYISARQAFYEYRQAMIEHN